SLPRWAQAGPAKPPRAPALARPRRVASAAFLVLAVALVPLSVLGVWNPWSYVVLRTYLGNPFQDVVLIALAAAAGAWLNPVYSEADQHRRVLLRWGIVVVLLVSLICFGVATGYFSRDIQVISKFGDRQVVRVTHNQDSELRLWAGSGLTV